MSALRVAAGRVESMDVLEWSRTGTPVRVLRHLVEHIHDTRQVPWLCAPVAMDVLSELRRMVTARRLVRAR